MKTKKEKSVIKQGGLFIDPENAGSSMQWYIKVEGDWNWNDRQKPIEERKGWARLDACMNLTDCSRTINWDFGGDEGINLEKLDKVIEEFQKFRKDLISMKKELKKAKIKYKEKDADENE